MLPMHFCWEIIGLGVVVGIGGGGVVVAVVVTTVVVNPSP